ncbi:hypothetical protein BGX28_001913 [Mortierella sp. GBA30]|nr:hypothetical protein BGX28_001913 [Mortierella sp. GBA30]
MHLAPSVNLQRPETEHASSELSFAQPHIQTTQGTRRHESAATTAIKALGHSSRRTDSQDRHFEDNTFHPRNFTNNSQSIASGSNARLFSRDSKYRPTTKECFFEKDDGAVLSGEESNAKAQTIELKQIPKSQHKQTTSPKELPYSQRDALGDSLQRTVEDLYIASLGSKQTSGPHQASSSTESRSSTFQETTRLDRIRATVQIFLNKRFSAHEYTVPRLFVVLPNAVDETLSTKCSSAAAEPSNEATTGSWTHFATKEQEAQSNAPPQGDRYRVYFLCECGPSFTHPLGSGLNHLHIAKHPGYEIDPGRLDEFFRRYGTMILTLLIFLKRGFDPDSSPTELSRIPSELSHKHQHSESGDKHWKKVEKISNLKRSDLPESIAFQIEQRMDRMIKYLERFQSNYSDLAEAFHDQTTPEQDNARKVDVKDEDGDEEERLQGLVSLSDLHRLYSFLGIANANQRLQSGQLGNLYRISNVRGQVSWVCVYHYRWTFLEKNIDEFEHWIVTRRGLFDKQSGSVMITLVSRAHTRTFCTWISKRVAPSLVEVHLKLAWQFGKKDLWRLAKALAHSTVTVLSLDGCSYAADSSYMALHKKYDPILYLLTHGQLRSLELSWFPSLFARLSQKHIKATSLRRLEFGQGMMIGSKDRGSFSHLLASCSSLRELILPGFSVTDLHVQAILNGIRPGGSLTTLDLSNTQMNDGTAILLAQGLFNTNICNLDLSKNERLSDMGAARIIRAVGPRLTSLKMAQTGFGDLAAAALCKSMDGISFTNTLRDQLQLQHRLDIAALTAGHRPGVRLMVDSSRIPPTAKPEQETKEKTHSAGHLVYLDVEDNQCTVQGFKSLAKIKSQLRLVYLNLSGSRELEDEACAQILSRVVSPAMVTLRLACTGFGDKSARSFAKALLKRPTRLKGSVSRIPELCQLEELDLQACSIGTSGFSALYEALSQVCASSCLRILDLGHCSSLEDGCAQQLLRMLIIPNSLDRTPLNPATFMRKWNRQSVAGSKRYVAIATTSSHRNSSLALDDLNGSQSSVTIGYNSQKSHTPGEVWGKPLLSRSDSVPAISPQQQQSGEFSLDAMDITQDQALRHPPMIPLHPAKGFFTNLRQLDLKSTRIGDGTAWVLAQALVQPWVMLVSLTLLEPMAMTVQGICWVVNALCENSTVQELGIGKSNISFQSDVDLFGAATVKLMEVNKRIRSLTTLGAPLGSVAKGLLLNQSLHSVYLIRSSGNLDDLQLMGQALAFNRSLLVFWMGGSEETLLGVLSPASVEEQNSREELENSASLPQQRSDALPERRQQEQKPGQQNVYRSFHLLHQQQQQQGNLQQSQQQSQKHHSGRQHRQHHQQNQTQRSRSYRRHGRTMSQKIGSAIKKTFSSYPKEKSDRQDPTPSNDDSSARDASVFSSCISPNGNSIDIQLNIQQTDRSATLYTAPTTLTNVWTRNPLVEGIRRNHSLIKVTLDVVGPKAMFSSLVKMETEDISSERKRGRGTGHAHGSALTNGANSSVVMDQMHMHEIQQQQQQQVNKKIQANRKLLRDRRRLGWEELKLLGVDDDVIREVCGSARIGS